MHYAPLREEIVEVARAMSRRGLSHGTSGNLSARVAEGMLITPSAMSYETLTPADVVLLTLEGEPLTGGPKPSTEWRLHAAVLAARPEARAVVHAHAPACTALACLRRGIPAFHYMVAVAGGADIRCAPYATWGTPELAASAVAALEGRSACLLANHGMLALGKTPRSALSLAGEVESLADIYLRALAVGEPERLGEVEMARIVAAFRSYREQD